MTDTIAILQSILDEETCEEMWIKCQEVLPGLIADLQSLPQRPEGAAVACERCEGTGQIRWVEESKEGPPFKFADFVEDCPACKSPPASAVAEPENRDRLELPACPKCGCADVRAESPGWTDYGVTACLSCDACDHQWEQSFVVGITNLWCMHILGPDDVHAAPSKAHAERAAGIFNATFGPISKQTDVLCEAVAAPWPHSPESHAADVGKFCAEWFSTQPAAKVSDAQIRAIHSDLSRFVDAHGGLTLQKVRASLASLASSPAAPAPVIPESEK